MCCMVWVHTVSAGSAEDAWVELVGKTSEIPPAFAYVENDPELPNILIYGDSISIGYTQRVREKLQGKANVYRLHCNGGDSGSFIKKMTHLHTVMRDGNLDRPWTFQWDVIHFNVGLHDLKYVLNGKNDKINGKQVASIDTYQANLEGIVAYLKELSPEADLIFATTTPVAAGEPGRIVGDAEKYNAAALDVLSKYPEIKIDDLYKLTKPNQTRWWLKPGNVHYSAMGSNAQGDAVAECIMDALARRAGSAHPVLKANGAALSRGTNTHD